MSLTDISVQAGTDGASLLLTGGSVDVRSFKSATSSVALVRASNLNLSATLGPVSFSAANVNLYSNSSAVTDWSFAGVSTAQPANTFQVDGGVATVTVGSGLAIGVQSFLVKRQTAVDAGVTLGTGTLFTLTLTDISVQAGTDG